MLKRFALIAIAVAATASQANAQTIPDNVDVAARVGNDFEAIGARIGSFRLFPEASLVANATDNVLANDSDRRSDQSLTARAGLRLLSEMSIRRADISTYFQRDVHARVQREDMSQYGVVGILRFGDPDGTRLDISTSAERLFIPRQSNSNVSEARSPVRYNRLNAEFAYTSRFNRLTILGAVRGIRSDYADARDRFGNRLDQDFRDVTLLRLRGEARYDLAGPVNIVGKFTYDRLDYDFVPGASTGSDSAVDLNRDSTGYRAEGGFGVAITNSVYGDFTIGHIARRFKKQTIPLRTNQSFSFSASLLWNIDPITTVRVNADRSFIESASSEVAGFRSTGGTLVIKRLVRPSLLLSLGGGYAHIVPIGVGTTRSEYSAIANANYYLSRRFSLIAEYSHGGRNTSADDSRAFKENRFRLGLKVTL